nr:juxtaposed with another zinc finger protein 1 isoform X1 [Gorilla gorilla gorilla]
MPVSHSSAVPSLTSTSTENRELGVEKTFDAFEMLRNEDMVVVRICMSMPAVGPHTDPRVLEKQELQQPTYVALSYINRFMTDAARREQESLKKKIQPKLSLTLSSSVSRGNVSTPPRHSSGSLTPPVTPPITPSSSFRSSTPTGSEYDEEEVDYEESDSDESWTTESAISSEAILSSMCMNGGEEKPFACPVPGCKKRYKNVNGIKYHAKNGHRTQIRVRKPFKCRCGKSYKTAQGLRHHTINFHPPVSAEIIRKMQQ